MKTTIKVSMGRCPTRDIAMHDAIVDNDPMFVEWDDVQKIRRGTWLGNVCQTVAGIDALPSVPR